MSDETALVLIDRASRRLAEARTAAEIIEAWTEADVAYDIAKRIAHIRGAHDELVEQAHHWQKDALSLESRAKVRLANEYDRAQAAGEVQGHGRVDEVPVPNLNEIGLTKKAVFEARLVRDAERNEPGIVERSLLNALENGDEPTKTKLRAAITEAAQRGMARGDVPKRSNRNPHYKPDPAFDAASALIGRCRDLVDVIDGSSVETILTGFVDLEDRKRGLRTINLALSYLVNFMEKANGLSGSIPSPSGGSPSKVRRGPLADS